MGGNPFKGPACSWGDPPRAGECDPYLVIIREKWREMVERARERAGA